NYFYVLLYISFFPQLIAGPIVKYRDISDRLADRRQDPALVANGMARFICGLAKKVLIANTMGQAADAVFAAAPADLSALTAWVGAVAYLFQIYYDFSGYSDMAIGLGRMFGFDFKENFLYPYGANNVQDFWRKWHVSLSTWFKEYLYIPLGGNRKGRGRTVFNRLVVFLLTGLWHGANWTFVVWGLWHGLFLLLEEFVPALRRLPKALGRVYTLLVVLLGFVVFRADTLAYGLAYIGRLFTGFGAPNAAGLEQLTPWFLAMLVAAVVGCAPIKPLVDKLRAAVSGDGKGAKAARAAVGAAALIGLVWCLVRLAPSGYNPFIYFRF
ncbi:MAG: MBOAT family protein, partial [Clostridia bacterium]|nr:MBOAT family protein [Clostridia bacterium]